MKNFGLRFGLMVDTIDKQIKDQGFKYQDSITEDTKDALNRQMLAIKVLHINGIISDGELSKICQRFVKYIGNHILSI